MRCTVTVFGRQLADLPQADADCLRGFLYDLDWCEDCRAYRKRQAAIWLDVFALPTREN